MNIEDCRFLLVAPVEDGNGQEGPTQDGWYGFLLEVEGRAAELELEIGRDTRDNLLENHVPGGGIWIAETTISDQYDAGIPESEYDPRFDAISWRRPTAQEMFRLMRGQRVLVPR